MPYGPQRLILINAGRYDFAEVELSGSLQIVGPNNTGKTTLINTLQFLYLDDRRQMDFGAYTQDQTRGYYFANQYSYILFQCLGARGQFVFGWRGQSKAAGGEPERFAFEGPFQVEDFLDEKGQVREPKAVTGRLVLRQFILLKTAHEHRELLLLATRGEASRFGIVALRDNDRYPQFRETLKNPLSLGTITQDQMRDRLLMLAGLSTEKYALDVRELFGEDYDKIRERKRKLNRFKEHQAKVENFVDTCARRDSLRGGLIHRWIDLRPKRETFVQEHDARIAKLKTDEATAREQLQLLAQQVTDARKQKESRAEERGGLLAKLAAVAKQEEKLAGFEVELGRAALKNVSNHVYSLKSRLSSGETKTREKVQTQLNLYRGLVDQKRKTIARFDRVLVTVLRRHMSDEELSPLAKLFNFDLLVIPVGEDGVQLRHPDDLVGTLRTLRQRIQEDIYRDRSVNVPLPVGRQTLGDLENPEAIRERLADDEEMLERLEGILKAIDEKEKLTAELRGKEEEETALRAEIFAWEKLQEARALVPQSQKELKATEEALEKLAAQIDGLTKEEGKARKAESIAGNQILNEKNQYNAVMDRFKDCNQEMLSGFATKSVVPAEPIPGDFDASVFIFLREQKQLYALDEKAREAQIAVERELGTDYSGADENETVRVLREELEAVADKENALGRDWELLLHQLRATFDQVLRSLGDIGSAADQLNRRLAAVQVSNLLALRMDVIEQSDIASSLRKLVNAEQPGLFDDSSSLEATIDGFRRKFDANPLLRYADLFTLRFTVTGEDGQPHHYHNLDQVESHGTTITVKVLFSLLVLRSLLREDASKSPLSEVPFFLDEIHSLDPANRRAIISTARQLGFIAITAAPESVSEVNALYYLKPQKGRVILRNRHRIGIKPRPAV